MIEYYNSNSNVKVSENIDFKRDIHRTVKVIRDKRYVSHCNLVSVYCAYEISF